MVRRAMVELVAEKGIHGTSMSQVGRRAGVATGTAYVHYESKEELLLAAFVEVKLRLGTVALSQVDDDAEPRDVFLRAWHAIYDHLSDDPDLARFLVQVEVSPLRTVAHESLPHDDPLSRAAVNLSPHLVDLPPEVLYDIGLAPAVRLVASGAQLSSVQIERLVDSCWNAVRRPSE